MSGHIHTDVLHITIFAIGTLVFAHFLRLVGAYLSSHGMQQIGVPIGSFATLNG